jgi:AcrR family transcriptional regulator
VRATSAFPARAHRRAPTPEQRQVDAERSKAALVDAALEEFASKGFAGARVRDIAERAGVSKDLITYHFGGKDGLLAAVQQAWLARRDSFVNYGAPLADNVARYLHDILADPRPMRLLVWHGLARDGTGAPEVNDDVYPSVTVLARRQGDGQIDPDLDLAALQLVLLGAVAAPIVFPDSVRRLFGMDASDPQFEARYRAGLLEILRTASAPAPGATAGTATGPSRQAGQ